MNNFFEDESLEMPGQQDNQFDQALDEINQEYTPEVADDQIGEALKRIEQAQLYKTLLTHDLFAQGSARPEVLEAVEREIRDFALNRLEVLVGVRPDTQVPVKVESQFTEAQAEFLKSLADRGLSRSATPSPVPQIQPVQVSKPIMHQAETQSIAPKLTPRVQPVSTPVAAQPSRRPAVRRQPVAKSQPAAQQSKRKRSQNISVDGRDLAQVNNPNKIPMPTPELANAHIAAQAAQNMPSLAGGEKGMILANLSKIFVAKNANDPDAE
jgi:hypothetical protein